MLRVGPYVFKKAETDDELEQIHRLNFRTFVQEIPQHADPGDERLVDKFHHKNTYFIACKGERVIAMLSVHDQPPFSIADRLPDPSVLGQPGMAIYEVRLLAIEPDQRNSNLFFGLIHVLFEHAVAQGKSHLAISGVSDRLPLYERLGFVALGPAVGSGEAMFTPMLLDVQQGLPKKIRRLKQMWEAHIDNAFREDKSEWQQSPPANTNGAIPRDSAPAMATLDEAEICLLPGPVSVAPAVRHAFAQPPMYHRGPRFVERFAGVRRTLSRLVGGRRVAILNGSGTLANETVAVSLAAMYPKKSGLLLVNGEFGQRLMRQADRYDLRPRTLVWEWGQPWQMKQIEEVLAKDRPAWVWGVHQESSTGVLNDLPALVALASRYETRVCLDCVSSLGAVPLDLTDVFLATGTSGKSLGSYAGAALIFADPQYPMMVDRTRLPSYLDLVTALATEGPCYTFPSSTLLALQAALRDYDSPVKARRKFQSYAALGRFVRHQLRDLDLPPLAEEAYASPVVTTFAPPDGDTSASFVERCLDWGIAIGGQSGYLAERRLVQIATMGAVTEASCEVLFNALAASVSNCG